MERRGENMKLLLAAISAEALKEGLSNMLVGLFVVFAVLIFLCLVIYCFRFLNKIGAGKEAPAAPALAAAPAPRKDAVAFAPTPVGNGEMKDAAVDVQDEIDGEAAAVILAAVAEEVGGEFEIKSIKKSV